MGHRPVGDVEQLQRHWLPHVRQSDANADRQLPMRQHGLPQSQASRAANPILHRHLPRVRSRYSDVGQRLLRAYRYGGRRFKRDLGECRFLPYRIGDVYLQRAQLEQPDQRDMLGHSDERKLQQRRHERLRHRHFSRRSRYGGAVEVGVRWQLRRHNGRMLQTQATLPANRVGLGLRIRRPGHGDGLRVRRYAAVHLFLVCVGRWLDTRIIERCQRQLHLP